MKYLLNALVIISLIACGGREKKAADNSSQKEAKYTYITPTQEMLESGKTTYDTYCHICHQEGVGGAAMITDKVRWQANRKKDLDILVQHVHDGYTGNYGTMTPMGTCMTCTKDELRNAIFYMMTEAGVL